MSYVIQKNEAPVFKSVSSPISSHQIPLSRSPSTERIGSPHAMWVSPGIFGFALLVIAILYFSTLGTFYSTGLGDDSDPVAVLSGSQPLPY